MIHTQTTLAVTLYWDTYVCFITSSSGYRFMVYLHVSSRLRALADAVLCLHCLNGEQGNERGKLKEGERGSERKREGEQCGRRRHETRREIGSPLTDKAACEVQGQRKCDLPCDHERWDLAHTSTYLGLHSTFPPIQVYRYLQAQRKIEVIRSLQIYPKCIRPLQCS